jgi:hypothetical protein
VGWSLWKERKERKKMTPKEMEQANASTCCGKRMRHEHDCAHGMPGTHMSGTERYRCTVCNKTLYAKDKVKGLVFILDV